AGRLMISLDAVTHAYGERTVLRDIRVELPDHRIGIVGANGSGKSTLVRLLNGLVLPTKGSVTVHGLDTRRDGAEVRRKVGFVFADPDAQIVMPTVAEDVAFSLRRQRLDKGEATARVTEVLRRFGLEDHADHPAHLLSGGQKQLLALASVLVTEPQVLVCDEPTTLLDLRNARQVTDLIASLPQQVVLVTHHLHLLEGWPRVLVIDEGRIVADGPAGDVLPYYVSLMSAPANPQA
ncbi:MAG TPA: ABC transporter ATP-binding protein, partial [Actinomycetales bacterium]|nr:ABC transporter ATP-binding protein [Actinomycetales bacterium]